MYESEAWVLSRGDKDNQPAQLKKEAFLIPELRPQDVLIEPLFGCWEANMGHAMERQPIDICHFRNEEKVVIGNAGVARILKVQDRTCSLKAGMICLVLASTEDTNPYGYPKPAYAYDAPNTIGILSKQTKVHQCQLIPLPENTNYSLQQWAAFTLRYLTAWGNWTVAYPSYRLMVNKEENPHPQVWAWGGGVALAELELARFADCNIRMISSRDERLKQLQELKIPALDRREFKHLSYLPKRYKQETDYREAYLKAEKYFLKTTQELTKGQGVAIFIDLIGEPVYRATLKALGWPGVITTAGWKHGMQLLTNRALECMHWHSHIHTHYVRRQDALKAIEFAEKEGWLPQYLSPIYSWDDIPQLAQDYQEGMDSYFPVYAVNGI